jgi:hypothetical protein
MSTPVSWIRQGHRWLSACFMLTVIANFMVRAQGEPPDWVTYAPLPPLALLMLTGLWLWVAPYVSRSRAG